MIRLSKMWVNISVFLRPRRENFFYNGKKRKGKDREDRTRRENFFYNGKERKEENGRGRKRLNART